MSIKYKLFTYVLLFLSITSASLVLARSSDDGAEFVYTITQDDHLTSIRDLFCDPHVKTAQLAKHNNLSDKNLVHPGQIIKIPTQWLKSKVLPIKLIVFSGDVSLSKFKAGTTKALTMQDQLQEGDTLTTGANSLAKVRFADDSVVNLQPNAKLKVLLSRQRVNSDKMDILVEVTQGRIEVLANPAHTANRQFKVKTPSAVAVVRGTQFRVGANAGKTIEETLDGAVDFRANKEAVNVVKGFGSFVKKGEAPLPPVELPPEPETISISKLIEKPPVALALMPQAGVSVTVAQLSDVKDFTKILSTQRVSMQGAAAQQLSFEGLEDGQYYVKLRSEDAQGLQSQDVVHPFMVDVYPLTPDPEVPLTNTPPSVGWPLQWSRIARDDQYFIQVSNSEKFEVPALQKTTFYNSFYLTHQLAPQAKYWRVGIQNEEGGVKYSQPIELMAQ